MQRIYLLVYILGMNKHNFYSFKWHSSPVKVLCAKKYNADKSDKDHYICSLCIVLDWHV